MEVLYPSPIAFSSQFLATRHGVASPWPWCAGLRRLFRSIGWPMPGGRNPREYLTTVEVAELMRCSVTTVYRLIQRGEFPAERLGTDYRIWRVPFDAWR